MIDPAQRFRELLQRRFGWRLEHDHGELGRVLASRRGSSRSAHAYLDDLESAPPDSAELTAVAEALAVSETYFFRNPEQFAVLADVVLPDLARSAASIRILSLGAASGEEAYSIAMTIRQLRKHRSLPPVDIVGIDVSRRAIERARRGHYSPWALRAVPEAVTREFFEKEGRHFRVQPDVAAMVRFQRGNLLQLAAVAPGPWDIVFFRNTFMYLTPAAALTAFGELAAMMPPRAYLFVGHAETLRGVSDAFSLRHSHETFYYQREPAGWSALPTLPSVPMVRTAPPPALATPAETVEDAAWFDEIARSTARIASLVDDRHAQAAPASGAVSPATASPLARILTLLREERHDDALAALGAGSDPEHLLLRAVLLVNMGKVAEARAAAEAVLVADGLQAGAHYVLALCAEKRRDTARAIRHDQTATRLDDTFAMPHLHLALIARRMGDHLAARQHATHARALFAAEDELRLVIFGGGFSRQMLIQICDAHADSRAS